MGLDSRTDEHARLLADPDYLAVVTALENAGGPLDVEALAERLVDRDVDVVSADEYERRLEKTLVSLHHARLPKLADVGLIEYDPGTNVASRRATAASSVEWIDDVMTDAVVEHLRPGGEDAGVGKIEGRDAVIEYGRTLADEADEELFTIYVDTVLLEDECICRVRQAIDRGVTMYLGSGDPDVRERARRHLPEALIWEPQMDWTNSPAYPRVGRLVLADRRHVMLAVLDERNSDGAGPAETAVVGHGENHPLVVLVRDLLGPRLDHLDFQSEDFTNELYS